MSNAFVKIVAVVAVFIIVGAYGTLIYAQGGFEHIYYWLTRKQPDPVKAVEGVPVLQPPTKEMFQARMKEEMKKMLDNPSLDTASRIQIEWMQKTMADSEISPGISQSAPDAKLVTFSGGIVALRKDVFTDERPLVLIFGSFT